MRSSLCLAAMIGSTYAMQGQTVAPFALGSAGGHITSGSDQLTWSVGQLNTGQGGSISTGIHQPIDAYVFLRLKVLLDGPFDPIIGLMGDELRTSNLLPTTEPYTQLGFAHKATGGGEVTEAHVLATTGNDAIVDWLVVELRRAGAPAVAVATRSALVQRDGDVVDVDGTSPVRLFAEPDTYFVAVHHRNHLAAMTAAPVPFGATPIVMDFTNGNLTLFGEEPIRFSDGFGRLWAGDVGGDGQVKYVGTGNDRDPVLVAIGGILPTMVISGYHSEDVNLDGSVKYTGPNNDRDRILQTIGGTVPTLTRTEQIP
jgi:hypothetical protein